jgi:hypothetical protein
LIQVLSGPPIKASGADSVVIVDNRNDSRDFLASRRARITPQQAGLPAYGGNRRVPGPRREEVALLAGVSVDSYTRLERGNLDGVSESVLEALPCDARWDARSGWPTTRIALLCPRRSTAPASGTMSSSP